MKKSVLVVLSLLLFLLPMVWGASPDLTVTETYSADYWRNGSIDGTATNQGYLTVFVPGSDVLQYTRVNLSANVSRTNIGTHTDADGQVWNLYRGAVPNATRLYREGDFDTYSLNAGRPELQMEMAITNFAGGTDIYNNDSIVDRNQDPTLAAGVNKVQFEINVSNPSSWRGLNSVDINVTFNNNTFGGRDLINISSCLINGAAVCTISDTNANGDFEQINWTGNVGASSTITILLNATIESGTNFADTASTSLNLNKDNGLVGSAAAFAESASSGLDSSSLLTGMTVTAKFSRGPIRQGVDLSLANNWRVRGQFRNIAGSLDYLVDEWRLYEVDPATGGPKATANLTEANPGWGNIGPGTTFYTDWFDTGNTAKPFFTPYFDWEVNWTGNEGYSVEVQGTLDLEDIFVVDELNAKTVSGGIVPDTNITQTIGVQETLTYLGDTNAPGQQIEIFSVVPDQGTYDNGTPTGFINFTIDCNSIQVLANAVDITNNVTINCVQPASEGYVQVTETDLSSTDFGANLAPNDVITVSYNVSTTESITSGVEFNFTGNSTVYSASGTPITEAQPTQTLRVSPKRLTAYKDVAAYDPLNPTLVNVSIRVDAFDKSPAGTGIQDVRVMDYVPNGTDFSLSAVTFTYNGGELVNGSNATITYKGLVTLSDGVPVFAYEYAKNSTGFWNGTLYDGDFLTIDYQINITQSGIYVMPSQIFGLDPDTGQSVEGYAVGGINVKIPEPLVPVEIEEGDLQVTKSILVGQPVTWMKDVEVYNPNSRPARAIFELDVFKDAVQVYANYFDPFGQKVEEVVEKDGPKIFWETNLDALETRNYEITVLTPPILETDRRIELLEQLPEKRVKLKMDIYLKNFAEENYDNIKLRLPIGDDRVMEVTDAFGNVLEHTGSTESTTISIPAMEGGGLKTVSVVYTESYPTIIVTPDKEKYDASSPVGLSILVINGGEKIRKPYLETEVYDPRMDTVHARLVDLESLEPLAQTETTEEFLIPVSAPTGTYIANVRFKEGLTTVSSGLANFYVLGGRASIWRTVQIFLIVLAGLGLIVLAVRRGREIRKRNKEENKQKRR